MTGEKIFWASVMTFYLWLWFLAFWCILDMRFALWLGDLLLFRKSHPRPETRKPKRPFVGRPPNSYYAHRKESGQ